MTALGVDVFCDAIKALHTNEEYMHSRGDLVAFYG